MEPSMNCLQIVAMCMASILMASISFAANGLEIEQEAPTFASNDWLAHKIPDGMSVYFQTQPFGGEIGKLREMMKTAESEEMR